MMMTRNLFFTALLIIAATAPTVLSYALTSRDGLLAAVNDHHVVTTVATHLGEGATGDGSVKSSKTVKETVNMVENNNEGQQHYDHDKMEKEILGRKAAAAGGGRFGAAASELASSTAISSTGHDKAEAAAAAGFVAFTSDYHSPRHHPPKNN